MLQTCITKTVYWDAPYACYWDGNIATITGNMYHVTGGEHAPVFAFAEYKYGISRSGVV